MSQTVSFYVFPKLFRDVIIGRQFLRNSHTLDLHTKRLQDAAANYCQDGTVAVKSVGHIQEHIKCWLDGIQVETLPDTGAKSIWFPGSSPQHLDTLRGTEGMRPES